MSPLFVLASTLALVVVGGEEEGPQALNLLQHGLEVVEPPGTLAETFPKVQASHVYRTDFPHDAHSGWKPSTTGQPQASAPASQDRFTWRKVGAEYVAMTLFVMIGCGSAMAIARDVGSAWVLQVSLAFGLAITVLAYSLGRYSGGQINCAVTLGLWVSNQLYWEQAFLNFIAQMLGSVTGATLLIMIFPVEKDKTGDIACNGIADGFTVFGVLVAELVMTFVLVLTVLESGLQTAPASGIAVIPIGFAVFLAHCVLIPIDGCSINPTRSFGPAVIASLRYSKATVLRDMWIFWLGPCCGALAAAGVFRLFQI
mmetsp:Transcript_138185/g.429565  ORF Transcript_138185/g.429565 Transcript_138185/m.429565 type:complete len:313 (+) Transcript_138185:77-1015(+)